MEVLTREQWIKKYASDARKAVAGTGLFPEVLLSQAILESSGKYSGVWYPGLSSLSRNANNYFGIKADASWRGDKVIMETTEYVNGSPVKVPAAFRKYPSVYDSFRDWVTFLHVNPRYAKAGVLSASTAEQQAERLHAAGYATDPSYSNLLKSLIASVRRYMPAATVVFSIVGVALLSFLIYQIID